MLTISDPAPDFELPGVLNDESRAYTLREMRGRWLVFFFYPADFTFICPTEVVGFSERIADFRAEGAEIYGASVDSIESHQAWARELGGVAYPLLSDPDKSVTQSYHVLHPKEGVALRATFIIDPEGVIQYSMASHMNVGRSVDETLRILKALRSGRLCPADWQPGSPTGDLKHRY